MPFQPVLEAFGGNLKIVGTGASTANQHMPHFADDPHIGLLCGERAGIRERFRTPRLLSGRTYPNLL